MKQLEWNNWGGNLTLRAGSGVPSPTVLPSAAGNDDAPGFVCLCLCVCVCVCVCVCMRPKCVCVDIHAYIYACTHVYMHTHIYTCMHIHTYIHTYIHTHTHTHTHTIILHIYTDNIDRYIYRTDARSLMMRHLFYIYMHTYTYIQTNHIHTHTHKIYLQIRYIYIQIILPEIYMVRMKVPCMYVCMYVCICPAILSVYTYMEIYMVWMKVPWWCVTVLLDSFVWQHRDQQKICSHSPQGSFIYIYLPISLYLPLYISLITYYICVLRVTRKLTHFYFSHMPNTKKKKTLRVVAAANGSGAPACGVWA